MIKHRLTIKHKKLKLIVLIIIIILAVCVALPSTRSYLIMGVYSASEASKSVMNQNNFEIKIPSSQGWYPFVMTFNTVNFGWWSGTDADMSIMYNFAEFDWHTFSSDIFNSDSPKHSSFYGAYALSQEDGYFGYDDSNLAIDEIILTFKYDYNLIVLDDLGCDNLTFDVVNTQIKENVKYLGLDNWTQIDAQIKTNAMLHNYKKYHTSYMQYGKPKETVEEDFPVIDMYGRLYIRVFEEYNSTIIVYVMSPSKDTIYECDIQILEHIKIKSID